ncbi:CopD family protein [Mycobacterium sp. ITM-2016-00317]|uniref:CopD family protein n=1 Tax=Mycobacterium sp. ITM-2016-00317 TaxID=2099694 RepID=UPI000D4FCFDB|nr:CopD family protein [Mycobacterium sp. ITM-2016-00317]WNG87363.1 CopD family protein [Mycobacterium sp. ITM-2016-00317]
MISVRAVAGGALVTLAGCVAAWALAFPSGPLGPALVRTLADAAAVVTVGAAVVPALDGARYRENLARRATAPLVVASAVWVVAELVRLVLAASEASGVPVGRLGWAPTWDFAVHTAAGRATVLTLVAAAAVCGLAVTALRSGPAGILTAGLAGVGIVGHPLTGHLSDSALGGLAVAVHALAAAVWCGTLAALVLTVDHRGQWARVLPRFSRLSLVCVVALLVGGVAAGLTVLQSPAGLLTTGYGRLLSAKILLTVLLVVLAWRNRELWLPAARTHRSTAAVSRTRAYTELAVMAVTVAAAATLSVTG